MSSFWMVVASLMYAVMALFVKLGSEYISFFGFVFIRGLFGIAIVGGWAILAGKSLRTPYPLGQITRSTFGTMAISLWFYSLAFLPLGTGITLNYTNPLFIGLFVVLGCLMRRERIQWSLVCTTVIGFIGVLVISDPSFGAVQKTAVIACLASSFCSALGMFQIRELARLKEPDWRTVFYFSLFTFVWGLGGMLFLHEAPTIFNLTAMVSIFGCGLCGTLAQVSMTKAFSSGNMLLSSLLQYTGIVFATVLGNILFDDPISFRMIAGIAIILASTTYSGLLAQRHEK